MTTGDASQMHADNRRLRERLAVVEAALHAFQTADSDGDRRNATEQALRSSEQRYRLLADTMLQGVVHHDANGIIIAMNPAAERILGKNRDRLMGSSAKAEADDTVHEDGSRFPGDDHPASVALATGRTLQGVVMGVFNPTLQQRRWIRIDAVPLFRDGGARPVEVYTVFEDITERRAADAELRSERRRLDLALKAGLMGVYENDLKTQQLWWSAEVYALFGVDGRNFVPSRASFLALVHPDDRTAFERAHAAVQAGDGSFAHDFRIVRPDGSVRWIGNRAQVSFDGQACALRHVGVAMDLTALKTAQAELLDADRQKDHFIATLAHELRNPLAPIANAAALLRSGALPEERLAWCSGVIERQVLQMSRLLDDLLDVSRVTLGKIQLRCAWLDIGTAVCSAIEMARPLIDGRGHDLVMALPEEPVMLWGDAARLAQICANLLTNAAKYTDRGGRIAITVSRHDDDGVRVSVRDNGIGLLAEHLAQVFVLFGQVAGPVDRSQGGLGIGLSLARRLVEMHGGTLSAHSAGLALGSEFVIRLPLRGPTQSG